MFEIISEMFESNLGIFGLIGLVLSIVILLKKDRSFCPRCLIYSLIIYLAAEILLGINYNSYMTEFTFLFVGAIAFGFAVGPLIMLIIKRKG